MTEFGLLATTCNEVMRMVKQVEQSDPANAAAWVTTNELTYDTAGRMRTHKRKILQRQPSQPPGP